jgi:hypothetical protein
VVEVRDESEEEEGAEVELGKDESGFSFGTGERRLGGKPGMDSRKLCKPAGIEGRLTQGEAVTEDNGDELEVVVVVVVVVEVEVEEEEEEDEEDEDVLPIVELLGVEMLGGREKEEEEDDDDDDDEELAGDRFEDTFFLVRDVFWTPAFFSDFLARLRRLDVRGAMDRAEEERVLREDF